MISAQIKIVKNQRDASLGTIIEVKEVKLDRFLAFNMVIHDIFVSTKENNNERICDREGLPTVSIKEEPVYLTRIWTVYEQFIASTLEIEVVFAMPEERGFESKLVLGGRA